MIKLDDSDEMLRAATMAACNLLGPAVHHGDEKVALLTDALLLSVVSELSNYSFFDKKFVIVRLVELIQDHSLIFRVNGDDVNIESGADADDLDNEPWHHCLERVVATCTESTKLGYDVKYRLSHIFTARRSMLFEPYKFQIENYQFVGSQRDWNDIQKVFGTPEYDEWYVSENAPSFDD